MPEYKFPITGAKELNRKLMSLAPRIAKKVIRQAVRPAAKLIQSAAKSFVAVDTGALKKSIKVRALKRSQTRIGMTVATNAGDNFFKGRTFYGGFLEFGFRRGKRSGALRDYIKATGEDPRGEVPPRPFMKKAFEAQRDQAGAMIVSILRAGIEREASS